MGDTVGDRTRGLQVVAAKKRVYGNQVNISDSDYEKFGKMLGESKAEIEEKVCFDVLFEDTRIR